VPRYAPNLDIVGVAEGGIPVDLYHNLAYVDRAGSSWTWVIGALTVGLFRGFDLHDLDSYLTPRGVVAINADQTQCSGGFTGLTIEQLFKPRYRDFAKVHRFAGILNHLIMSRTGTPRGPLFIGIGLSDSIGDGVMVEKDVQELASTYCQRGVPVEFQIYKGLIHTQAGPPFFEQSQAFLSQRFENLPFQSGCSDIGPGNSIAPVLVPQSGQG
jgi:hypothetical protein